MCPLSSTKLFIDFELVQTVAHKNRRQDSSQWHSFQKDEFDHLVEKDEENHFLNIFFILA